MKIWYSSTLIAFARGEIESWIRYSSFLPFRYLLGIDLILTQDFCLNAQTV